MTGRPGVTLTSAMRAQVKHIDLHYRDVLGLGEDLGRKGGWKGSEGQELFGPPAGTAGCGPGTPRLVRCRGSW
jgi:hypothetical protein